MNALWGRLVAATKRDSSRPTARSESVAGTRSFSRRGEHFHEALNPQHARPGTTSRDESVIPMPTLSLDMPPGIACPCIVLGAFSGRISERREVSALYCQWFSYLVRVDCQFLNTHKTRSTANATTKWGAWRHSTYLVLLQDRVQFYSWIKICYKLSTYFINIYL